MPSITSQGRVSSFPGGFPAGLAVLGMPLVFPAARGEVYYVSNSTASLAAGQSAGSASGRGTFNKPFSTLQQAVNACVANRGDIIIICEGHAENIASATALAINKAGIKIIGMGQGPSRPTFTLTTANTATITVSANNVTITNCVFVANFLNIAVLFDLTTATGFVFDNNEVRDTSATLNFLIVFRTSATDNNNDDLRITQSNFFLRAASGAVMLWSMRGSIARAFILDNIYSTRTVGTGAVIVGATGKVATNVEVARNVFNLVNTTGTATGLIHTTDSSTHVGVVMNNFVRTLATTPLLITAGTGLSFLDNKFQHTADRSGLLSPAVDS